MHIGPHPTTLVPLLSLSKAPECETAQVHGSAWTVVDLTSYLYTLHRQRVRKGAEVPTKKAVTETGYSFSRRITL